MTPPPFHPARALAGPHRQTIVSSLATSPEPNGAKETLDIPVDNQAAVRLVLQHPSSPPKGTWLLIHGLAGCADSPYLRWCAHEGLARGWNVVRMNLRGTTGTYSLSKGLGHAAQSDDIGAVVRALGEAGLARPLVATGFSLGASMLTRYAGQHAGSTGLDGLAAVSVPLDLSRCADALESAGNLVYRLYFLRRLLRMVREADAVLDLDLAPGLLRRIRSLRAFDAMLTAPRAGYTDVESYYADASAGPWLSAIDVPALVLVARDDPFVPFASLEPHLASASPSVRVEVSGRGGHVGFWQRSAPRFWPAQHLLDHFEKRTA